MATLNYQDFNGNFTSSTSWKLSHNLAASVAGSKIKISGTLQLTSTGAYSGYSLSMGASLTTSASGGDYGQAKSGGGTAPSLKYTYFDYYTEDTHEQYYTAQIVQPSGIMWGPSSWKLTVPATHNDGTHGTHKVSNAGSKLAVSTSKYVSSVSRSVELLADIPASGVLTVFILLAQNNQTPKYAQISLQSPVIITKPTITPAEVVCGGSVVVGLENVQPDTTHALVLRGKNNGVIYYAAEEITTAQTVATLTSWANGIQGTAEPVAVELTTYNGDGVELGTATTTLQLLVPAYTPQISLQTEFLQALGNYAVQSKTTLKTKITASSSYGATISNYALTISGETLSGAEALTLLTQAGEITATASATDSRGKTATTTATFTVYDYAAPAISKAQAQRNGQAVSVLVGSVISPINGANARTINILYNGQVVGTKSNASAEQLVAISGAWDTTETFDLVAQVVDSLGSAVSYDFQIETEEPWLSASPDHKGTAIGKPSSGGRLFEVGWNTEIGTAEKPVTLKLNGEEIGGGIYEQIDITNRFTRTGGNCAISNAIYKRAGNVVFITFLVKGSSSTASAGNFWAGTISNSDNKLAFPSANATGASYYSATPLIYGLTPAGGLTVRNASASSRNMTDGSNCSLCYVI